MKRAFFFYARYTDRKAKIHVVKYFAQLVRDTCILVSRLIRITCELDIAFGARGAESARSRENEEKYQIVQRVDARARSESIRKEQLDCAQAIFRAQKPPRARHKAQNV